MQCAPHAVLCPWVALTLLPSCRLDALLSALSKAKGEQLTNPWPIIHPDNAVTSLSQALDPKHDAFYRKLPKFKFLTCLDHYETGEYATYRAPLVDAACLLLLQCRTELRVDLVQTPTCLHKRVEHKG